MAEKAEKKIQPKAPETTETKQAAARVAKKDSKRYSKRYAKRYTR